jgi:hypothetical protein
MLLEARSRQGRARSAGQMVGTGHFILRLRVTGAAERRLQWPIPVQPKACVPLIAKLSSPRVKLVGVEH